MAANPVRETHTVADAFVRLHAIDMTHEINLQAGSAMQGRRHVPDQDGFEAMFVQSPCH